MSITHTITGKVASDQSGSLETSYEEVGESEITINTQFSAGTVKGELAVAFSPTSLQSMVVWSSTSATVYVGGTDEVQRITITGTPAGGTFTATFEGQTTAAIAYNATAAAVQSALEALSNVAVGDVVCSGGPFPGTPVDTTFKGNLAVSNRTQMTTSDSFTGGSSPASAVTTTTGGVTFDTSFSLAANAPKIYSASSGYVANPFSVASVMWRVTCTAAARVKGKLLVS